MNGGGIKTVEVSYVLMETKGSPGGLVACPAAGPKLKLLSSFAGSSALQSACTDDVGRMALAAFCASSAILFSSRALKKATLPVLTPSASAEVISGGTELTSLVGLDICGASMIGVSQLAWLGSRGGAGTGICGLSPFSNRLMLILVVL